MRVSCSCRRFVLLTFTPAVASVVLTFTCSNKGVGELEPSFALRVRGRAMDARQQLQNDANPSVDTNRAASGPDPVDAECFTVVTYNILSSALASPDWFRNCDPRDLEADTRLQRVLHKLGAQVEKRAIICLQEVSRGWSGKLHAFFQQRNYTFIDSLYGAQVSGYMGVGLAFPNERWRAADIDIQRIADTKDAWIVPEREKVWRPSSSESRVGDWTCPSCGAHVFANKVACYRCHAPKPEVVPETNGAALGAPLGAPLGAGPLGGALSSLWDWLRARCGAGAIGVRAAAEQQLPQAVAWSTTRSLPVRYRRKSTIAA